MVALSVIELYMLRRFAGYVPNMASPYDDIEKIYNNHKEKYVADAEERAKANLIEAEVLDASGRKATSGADKFLQAFFQPDKTYIGRLDKKACKELTYFVNRKKDWYRLDIVDEAVLVQQCMNEAEARTYILAMASSVVSGDAVRLLQEIRTPDMRRNTEHVCQDKVVYTTSIWTDINDKGEFVNTRHEALNFALDKKLLKDYIDFVFGQEIVGKQNVTSFFVGKIKSAFSKKVIARTLISMVVKFVVSILLTYFAPVVGKPLVSEYLTIGCNALMYVMLISFVERTITSIKKRDLPEGVKACKERVAYAINPKHTKVFLGTILGCVIALAIAIICFPWQFSVVLAVVFGYAAMIGDTSELLYIKRKITQKQDILWRGCGLAAMSVGLLIGAIVGQIIFGANSQDFSNNNKTETQAIVENVNIPENSGSNGNVSVDNKKPNRNNNVDDKSQADTSIGDAFFATNGELPDIYMEAEDAAIYYAKGLYELAGKDYTSFKTFFADTEDEVIQTYFDGDYMDLSEAYDYVVAKTIYSWPSEAVIAVIGYNYPEGAVDSAQIGDTSVILLSMVNGDRTGGWRLCENEDTTDESSSWQIYDATMSLEGIYYWENGYPYQHFGPLFNVHNNDPFMYEGLLTYEVLDIFEDEEGNLYLTLYFGNDTANDLLIESLDYVAVVDNGTLIATASEPIDLRVSSEWAREYTVMVPASEVATYGFDKPQICDLAISYSVCQD